MSWVCSFCNNRSFTSRKALTVHSLRCNRHKFKFQNKKIAEQQSNLNNNINDMYCEVTNYNNDINDDESDISDYPEYNLEELYKANDELLKQAELHKANGYRDQDVINDPEYLSGILLLHLLKKAKCPIYLFDEIVQWAKKSHSTYNLNLKSTKLCRKSCIKTITKKHDLEGMYPTIKSVFCEGLNSNVNVVVHDFKQCLYSLLMDDELMAANNILDPDSIEKEIDDVNTGSVFKKALKYYVKDTTKEKLVPIIFFTDKTHTDIHGRLCVEPVQFTLGIFKREIRNDPKAWRTIGYVTDSIYDKKCTTEMKQQDYHVILNVILESFKDCQKKPIQWKFSHEKDDRVYILKVPCLFIIGDTENHDKLCGRMQGRSHIQYLCRYCNIHRDDIDNPFETSKHTNMSDVQNLISKKKKDKLASMSMFCVTNAWHDVDFCDRKRGIHGATLAELLHSLQQGIFEYTIRELFSTKKIKQNVKKRRLEDSSDDDEDYVAPTNEDLGRLNVFSVKYEARFEQLCKQYGKMLQHQSDRSLPRTYFNTKYMSVTRKNGHEMAGLILVFLIIFASSEGQQTINLELGSNRCAAYLQVLELLLMLESFCKQEKHTKTNLLIAKEAMPEIMKKIKDALNRTDGCGMKIIKFHLIKHFAEDILRYGSMKNFDSAIGERNHCTEVKEPARHTQRRKINFELQTAKRYYENLAINVSENDIIQEKLDDSSTDSSTNKEQNIIYVHEEKNIYKREWKSLLLCPVNWRDTLLYQSLLDLCIRLVEQDCVHESEISFFTQHNRNNCIFRANPQWQDTEMPWYDWARVEWDGYEMPVPAQMLIFIDLTNNFKNPFQFGQSYVAEPGVYAIARSFQDEYNIKAHYKSKLVRYGEFVIDEDMNPELCMFSVESIAAPMVAVPFSTESNIINAKEWIMLESKNCWYDNFLNILKDESRK
jgi:hypothetical protein